MDVKDIKGLKWGKLPREIWDNELEGFYELGLIHVIRKNDIESFLYNIIKNYANKLSITVYDCEKMFIEKNKHYYDKLSFYYKNGNEVYKKDSKIISDLFSAVWVPYVTDYVQNLYNGFKNLSNSEKKEFLKRIEPIKSKLDI